MNANAAWIRCEVSLPPNGEVVETKIDDVRGVRNETTLRRHQNLWFLPDGSMYVYYVPTHWRRMVRKTEEKFAPAGTPAPAGRRPALPGGKA